jgi:capsular polysaccharide export protein
MPDHGSMDSKFSFLFQHRVHAFGFHYWKHRVLRAYVFPANVIFHYDFQLKNLKSLDPQRDIFCVWSSYSLANAVISLARKHQCRCFRLEDGFLRSMGLGCLFTKPWSLAFDSCGIYYDPSRPSDLENTLRCKEFSPQELQRARQFVETIRLFGITKYNVGTNDSDIPKFRHTHPIILVPGQVEDDASILLGTSEICNNLQLLQVTRDLNPRAWIIYKPHPDLQFTKKHLRIPQDKLFPIADEIVMNASISSLLQRVDSIYTLTSLTGFEAILYGKEVHCFGLPFYAGWKITHDILSCPRRGRQRTLEELVAATYIDYPRYYHWDENKRCEVEEVLMAFQKKTIYGSQPSWKQRIGRWILNGVKRIKNTFT